MMNRIFIVSLTSVALLGCGSQFQPETPIVAQSIADNVGCKSFTDKVWTQFYKSAVEQSSLPDAESVSELVTKKLQDRNLTAAQKEKLESLSKALYDFYYLVAEEAKNVYGVYDNATLLKSIAAIELDDNSTVESTNLNRLVRSKLSEIQTLSSELSINCATGEGDNDNNKNENENPEAPPLTESPVELPPPTEQNPDHPVQTKPTRLIDEMRARLNAPVFGAMKVVGVLYQSCEAVQLDAMNADTESAQGITRTGTHPDGIGGRRYVTDLQALLKTHHYLKNHRQPSSVSCFDVTQNPPIYDYGGKPNTDADRLNFFKNAGSGTTVLGTDCSGFVFSSLAAAGLKIKSGVPLRPQHVHNIGSRQFRDPIGSKMDCIAPITVTASEALRPGDIVAINGHVLMVDDLGSDPFGLKNITDVKQCKSSNISYRNFTFNILQSSPSKGGHGVNRYKVADYLAGTGTIRDGLEDYALEACFAKFGEPRTPKVSTLSIVRHTGTSECIAPEVALQNQSCFESCTLE